MVFLSNVMAPVEGICHQQPNTEAHVSNRSHGNGTLYITDNTVQWVSDGGLGFTLVYPSIVLHAVSKDQTAYPRQCLYLQVEGKLDAEDGDDDSGQSSGDDDPDYVAETTEVRFVPDDTTALEMMYGSMCDCQALHPDPEDSQSGDEGAGDFIEGPEDEENMTPQHRATLARLEALLQAGDNSNNTEVPVAEIPVPEVPVPNGNHNNDEGMDMDDEQFADADGNNRPDMS